MCGIVGYLGKNQACDILMDGLRRLEYRGYDSAGIAVNTGKGVTCIKETGKIARLSEKLKGNDLSGTIGIAHTRWATHGVPSVPNAHPHQDNKGDFFLVHNGIIENYQSLKTHLQSKGHKFVSETDTEVIAHLLADLYNGDLKSTFQNTLKLLKGAYALVVLHKDHPDRILAGRLGSPLILGLGKEETIIASDVSAIMLHTRNVVYMNDGEIADVTLGDCKLYNTEAIEINKDIQQIEFDIENSNKGEHEHFMLKEINEQPDSLRDTIRGRIQTERGNVKLGGLEKIDDQMRHIDKLKIVVCGTARHAGMIGQYLFEELANIATEVDFASEFRYRKTVWDDNTAVIAISQSGETADTLAAIREAGEKGALTIGIVNGVGSTIARETEAGVYNHIGPEIAVASTKAFTSQLAVLVMLAVKFGRQRLLSLVQGKEILEALQEIPDKVQEILKQADRIRDIAARYTDFDHFAFIGRKYNYPLALEGALKLKEISYIHAEGLPSGELKHGSIALIDEKFPSLVIIPDDSVYEKNISNMQEIKSRKGPIIAIASEGNTDVADVADEVIYIPKTLELLTPILTVIPMQMFAYYVASAKGLDVDKPRNLAKSVTVE